MGGIDKVGAGQVGGLEGPDDDGLDGPAAPATATSASQVAPEDAAAAAQGAWQAHAADLGSVSLEASIDGGAKAGAVKYEPELSLEEFYAGAPPEVKALDDAVGSASGAFKDCCTGDLQAAGAKAVAEQERGLALLDAMVALASELRGPRPDAGKIATLADAADAKFLDYAAKGDPKARAVMAEGYGRSADGGGAFGNDVMDVLGRAEPSPAQAEASPAQSDTGFSPAQSAPPPLPATPSPVSPAPAPAANPATQAEPAPSPAPGGAKAPAKGGGAKAPAKSHGTAAPAKAGGAKGAGKAGGASHAKKAKPAGYDSLDAARGGDYVRKGSKGPEVKALQRALNAAGIKPPLPENGVADAKTDAAIRKFQADHGCVVDGLVGPETMGALDKALGLPVKSTGGGGSTGKTSGPGGTSGGGSVGAPPPLAPGSTRGQGARVAALQSARSQMGVRERSGNNDGVPAQRYSRGAQVPWCANFVSWNFRQAGHPLPGNQVAIGSCIQMEKALKNSGMWLGKIRNPQPGDVIMFGSPPHHVGIVDHVSNGQVHTVEGNSGNRVTNRSYPLGSSKIGGYGRPG